MRFSILQLELIHFLDINPIKFTSSFISKISKHFIDSRIMRFDQSLGPNQYCVLLSQALYPF